jgi:radical SAM protein with 4Fe4S-binding SPASM domain
VGTTITDETEEQVKGFRDFMRPWCDKITVGKTREIIIREGKTNFPECPEAFDKLSIDWDGLVTACCGDFDRFMLIGDAKTQTLKEIFNGERINYFRKMLADKRHNELEICKICALGGSSSADIKNTKKVTTADT